MKLYHWTLLYAVLFIAAACRIYVRLIETGYVKENKNVLEDMLADALDRAAERMVICEEMDEPDPSVLEDIRQTFVSEAKVYADRVGITGTDELLMGRTVLLAVVWSGHMYVLSEDGNVRDIGEGTSEEQVSDILQCYADKRGLSPDIRVSLPEYDELMFLNGTGERAVMLFYFGGRLNGTEEYVNIIASGAGVRREEYIYGDEGSFYHRGTGCGSAEGGLTARFHSFKEAAAAGFEPCPSCVLQGIE